MNLSDPKNAASQLKKNSPLRPTLALALGSGFHPAQKPVAMRSSLN